MWLDPPKGFSVNRHVKKVTDIRRPYMCYDGLSVSPALIEDMIAVIAESRRYRNPVLLRDRLPALLPSEGGVIDRKDLARVAMFLLEYDSDLRSGTLPKGWNGRPPIWVAAVISDVAKLPRVKPGMPLKYIMKVTILNGPPAGQVLANTTTPRYASYLPLLLGVPKRTNKRVMPRDSIGMYLMGCYGLTKTRPVSLLEMRVSSSMKTKNRQLFARRHP